MTTFYGILNKYFYHSSRYNASDEEDVEPQVATATGPLPPTPQPQQAMANRDTQKLDMLIEHLERFMERLKIEDNDPSRQ